MKNTDLGNKEIFAHNLCRYMDEARKNQKEICDALGFKYMTFSDWVRAKTYPRIDKIEKLANYFGIQKSDLIEKNTTEEERKQIKATAQNIRQFRLLRGLSLESLSRSSGIDIDTLSSYENGNEPFINYEIAKKIANALSVPYASIGGLIDAVLNMPPDPDPMELQKKNLSWIFFPKLQGLMAIKGISENEFRQSLDISEDLFEQWRHHTKAPSNSLLFKIADFFQVTVNFLKGTDYTLSVSCYRAIPSKISIQSLVNIDGLTMLPIITIPDDILGEYAGNTYIIFMHANADMEPTIKKDSMMAVLTNISFSDLKMGDVVVGIHKDSLVLRRFRSRTEDPVRAFFAEDPAAAPIYLPSDPAATREDFHLLGKVVMYCTSL